MRRSAFGFKDDVNVVWMSHTDYVDFKEIIEPLRMLFKDEVRQLGREANACAGSISTTIQLREMRPESQQ